MRYKPKKGTRYIRLYTLNKIPNIGQNGDTTPTPTVVKKAKLQTQV